MATPVLSPYAVRGASSYRNPGGASDYLRRTADLPLADHFTICGWAFAYANPTTYVAIATVENGTSSASLYRTIGWRAGGVFGLVAGGEASFPDDYGSDFPFFWAMSRSPAGNLFGYARRAHENTLQTVNTSAGSDFTNASLTLANDSYSDSADIALWNVRVWSGVALDAAALFLESISANPVSRAALHGWWPLEGTLDQLTFDRSSNGRHLTRSGSGRVEPFVFPRSLLAPLPPPEVVAAPAGGTTDRTFAIAAGADAVAQGVAISAQSLTSAGAATPALSGQSLNAQDLASAGAATVSFAGAAVVPQLLTSAGLGTVSFAGTALSAQTISASGAAAVDVVGQATSAQGLVSAGSASALFVGEDANSAIAARTLATDGAATVSFHGLALSAQTLVVSAAATVEFAGTNLGAQQGVGGASIRHRLLREFESKEQVKAARKRLPQLPKRQQMAVQLAAQQIVADPTIDADDIEQRLADTLAPVATHADERHVDWLLFMVKLEARRARLAKEQADELLRRARELLDEDDDEVAAVLLLI